jgi:hypothetical protein
LLFVAKTQAINTKEVSILQKGKTIAMVKNRKKDHQTLSALVHKFGDVLITEPMHNKPTFQFLD